MRSVFLDHQSTTPVLPEVWEAMKPYFTEFFGNPSSLHRHGLRARDALAKARAQLAAFLHAESPDDIIFTSGGTEAVNLAVKGVAYASQRRSQHLVLSAIEHPAVLNSVEFLGQAGFSSTQVAVDREGLVDPEAVRAAMRPDTILVCLHHVNHDIGTIEPIRAVAEIAAERGVPLFVDAVASAGWLPLDVQALGAALLAVSPHRFYGPKGVGILYRHRRARVSAIVHGGVQEGARRAGTENVPAIVGAGVAAEMAQRELESRREKTAALQRQLLEKLRKTLPHLALNGPEPGPNRISTNLNLSVEFVEGEGLALLLDLKGVAVASGTACMSKAVKVSHVLAALGLPPALAQASVILSLGKDNTAEEMDAAAEKIAAAASHLRSLSPLWEEFQKGAIGSPLG